MPLWKTILSYDGTPFHGWQVQPNLPTIQGTLAHAIHHITRESVLPQGSGRTDAGVHALAQVASFFLESPIPPANFLRALNHALPPSIRVLSIEHAAPSFHARHSAIGKTYEYRIHPTNSICSPMQAPYVWPCPFPLDMEQLQEAATYILGTHDFTSFAAVDPDLTARIAVLKDENSSTSPPSGASDVNFQSASALTTRTIYESAWRQHEDLLIYRVTGTGFLHHMVRNLVGTFAEAGTGRIPANSIPTILAARNRSAAGPTAPASGLFLVKVEY
ncbi:tRNA pseudouridine synthase A [Edaphobacter paludis]|uniref:tRNA pseudouridine synthase A n=1 Tax=Edaphobacter paludis TaxID=3035702 RepID=A0AAU7D0J0_9BACT